MYPIGYSPSWVYKEAQGTIDSRILSSTTKAQGMILS